MVMIPSNQLIQKAQQMRQTQLSVHPLSPNGQTQYKNMTQMLNTWNDPSLNKQPHSTAGKPVKQGPYTPSRPSDGQLFERDMSEYEKQQHQTILSSEN